MNETTIPAAGFDDPVRDAQRIFRATLEALARPTLPQKVEPGVLPPAPLSPMAGAVVLALCDAQTPVWLDPALRFTGDVEAWVRFHTGAPIVDDTADALFCVASCPSALPPLHELPQGTDEEPHRSATVVIDAADSKPAGSFVVTGPGVNGTAQWDGAGLPAGRGTDFLAMWDTNTRRFPRGVDLIFAADGEIRGLPRTTKLTEAR